MKRFAFAAMVIMALFLTGCMVPRTNDTFPAQTSSAIPDSTRQPTITADLATFSNPPINTTNTTTNGTNIGNGSISPSAGDLFLIAPLNARYYQGDVITVHGTTILAAGDPLLVEVVSASFGPTVKTNKQFFTGVSGVVHVGQGPSGGPNTWSFSFPTEGFTPDTYIVTVSGLTVKVEDSTTFDLLPRMD